MALKVAGALIGILAGAADIGAAFGLSAAAEKKAKELEEKMNTLRTDSENVGDLYDRVYYVVNSTMKRIMDAVEQLPDDFLTEIEESVKKVLEPTATDKIFSLMATYLGVAGLAVTTISGAVRTARAIKAKLKDSGKTKYNIMFGASGSIPSHDFHMSMQNELVAGFSIHTSQLKIWTFPYRETIQWQCLPPTRYVNARDFR